MAAKEEVMTCGKLSVIAQAKGYGMAYNSLDCGCVFLDRFQDTGGADDCRVQ